VDGTNGMSGDYELIGLEHLLDTAPADEPPNTSSNGHGPDTSFKTRVTDRRVNLLERIRAGIPEIDYLPASHGMLVRGKRHQIVAPKKTGKSFSMLVHWVDMAQAGAIIIILDRENGADLYAQRLEQILTARKLNPTDQETINALIGYYEFPRLGKHDQNDLTEQFGHADIVVFDSQRMFLSDLGLEENNSDDYAQFAAAALDPLFQNGVATVVLDNSGHNDSKRSRGSSSKGDLNEILFSLAQAEGFDQNTTGKLVLTIEDSRFGNRGTWEMRIGGGDFGSWTSATDQPKRGAPFTPTRLMQKVSEYLATQPAPLSKNQVSAAVVGQKTAILAAIDRLYENDYLHFTNHGYTHYKSYQEGDPLPNQEPVPGGSRRFPEPVARGGSTGSTGSFPLQGEPEPENHRARTSSAQGGSREKPASHDELRRQHDEGHT
jgi:hypothetical protein